MIDFTIEGDRLVRPGASRAASPEEIALWNALEEELETSLGRASTSEPVESIPVEPIEPYEDATGPGLDTDPVI